MPKGKIGIELGTKYLRICTSDKDEIIRLRNVIALDSKMQISAVGNEAYGMYEKEPYMIHVISPMKQGVIGDYTNVRRLLHVVLRASAKKFHKYHYYAAIPSDITQVEKKAFYDLIMEAAPNAKTIHLMEKPILDAIGLGIHLEEAKGNMIINIGAQTCEVSVVCLGGIVCSRLLKIGTKRIQAWMIHYMKREIGIQIGYKSAERFMHQYLKQPKDSLALLKGRDLVSGLPRGKKIKVAVLEDSICELASLIEAEAKEMLERIPPQLVSDIMTQGIYVSGGGANILSIKDWLEKKLTLEVHVGAKPEDSVILGLKKICSRKNDR